MREPCAGGAAEELRGRGAGGDGGGAGAGGARRRHRAGAGGGSSQARSVCPVLVLPILLLWYTELMVQSDMQSNTRSKG